MRVYLAGPMTGHPDLNYPAFHDAAARLRAHGFDVVNPAEIVKTPGLDWLACMRLDIPALLTCEAIVLLPGWQSSRGARLEYSLARQLGFAAHQYTTDAPGFTCALRRIKRP
ncbi:DUF4406 domain-containing protein [Bordetella avium]|uniref:DUF4406 domain-containing protein n=1 Tax=Bordetella avium TaxID=521 RepID=UPI0039FCAD2C